MSKRVEIGALRIDEELYALVRDEIAPDSGVDADTLWTEFGKIVRDLGPKNRALLNKRNAVQRQIDWWARPRQTVDQTIQNRSEIGYLVPEGGEFQVSTKNVDREIAMVSGPQLVVPLDNARYALNAANARWGSLYDALYGTDVIPENDHAEKGESYNPVRGSRVIAKTEAFLDNAVGLPRSFPICSWHLTARCNSGHAQG
jgi:malate synthase